MFGLYALLLMVSGALLILMGSALSGQSRGSRVINILVGFAFFGYGFYLEFLFGGGHYYIFLYAFAVPVLLIVNTFKARKATQAAHTEPPMAQAPQLPAPAAPASGT